MKEEMMGLEKEFIASASLNDTKEKPKVEAAIESRATTTTKATKRGRKGASPTNGSPPTKKSQGPEGPWEEWVVHEPITMLN